MTEIKCDYDGPLPADVLTRIGMLVRVARLTVDAVSYRRTAHGWHVIVYVRQRVAMWRVVCCQAILGSDWKRETFNLRRVMAWRDVPGYWRGRANVLYERHYKPERAPWEQTRRGPRWRMGKCGTNSPPMM